MESASYFSTSRDEWLRPLKQAGVFAAILLAVFLFFRNADFGYDFHWAVLYEKNPTYHEIFGLWLLKGLVLTINISIVSAFLALVLGTFFGIGRLSGFKPFYYLSTCYVEIFRNTPLLVQMFFWYFAFPLLLPDHINSWLNEHNFEFTAAVASLSIYTGSYIAEIVRAGIQAIPPGHVEAAKASGLTELQILRYVVLPQAFRITIPPLGSEFLNNLKNSSLAMTIGVGELCWQFQQIESFTFRGFEASMAGSVLYLTLCLMVSFFMNSMNHYLKVGAERKLNTFDRILGVVFRPLYVIFTVPGRFIENMRENKRIREKNLKAQPAVKPIISRIFQRTVSLLSMAGKALLLAVISVFLILLAKGLWSFNWSVIWANLPSMLIWTFPNEPSEIFFGLGGLAISFLMAVIVICVSFVIGLFAGLGRLSENPVINTPSVLYIEIIRGNPLIMVIFWVYFFSPIITGVQINVFWSATVAFIIFSGAYLAEIVRAGVEAIPPGQREAATASGLSYFQTMRYVILPQALKIMIPAFVNQFITIFKDTSLAYIIGVFELTTVAQTISNRLMIYPFEIYVTIGVLYFICCYSMSIYARRLERKYSAGAA